VHDESVGWIVTLVDDPAHAAGVASSIDAHFSDHGQQTFTQSERTFAASFGQGMDMMMDAMTLASFALLAIMALLVGNTIAMGVRERNQEYATLRAIGFTPWHISASIVVEALVLGAVGALLGLALAYPLIDGALGRWVGQNLDALLPYFQVGLGTAALALCGSVVVSMAAAVLPAARIFRLSVTSALRQTA
jgi:putative ABC transport system permease protein